MKTTMGNHAQRLLGDMERIRRFEDKCAELYSAGHIRGFLHLYVGQEAVAVGVNQALQTSDAVLATYREHAHAIVRGVSMDSIMAEMFGRYQGCSKGRGGSMHLFDTEHGFYGGHAIVAGGMPMAVGLALAAKRLKQQHIVVCFFGEGAAAEGEFHESLNLAALWKLPILFVCENNGYAMGTALDRSESVTDISAKAAGYGIGSASVDGMDVLAVEEAARIGAAAARRNEPHFLECRTYRFRAHSMYDAELYREKAEVERWKKRDPIVCFRARAEDSGWLTPSEIVSIQAAADDEVAKAIEFAMRGSLEAISHLTDGVTARGERR